jgi:hypothetical protein
VASGRRLVTGSVPGWAGCRCLGLRLGVAGAGVGSGRLVTQCLSIFRGA